jgi:hypothetical protein
MARNGYLKPPSVTEKNTDDSRSVALEVYGLLASSDETFGLSYGQKRPVPPDEQVVVSIRQIEFLLQIAISALRSAPEGNRQSPMGTWLVGYQAASQRCRQVSASDRS